MLSTVLNSPRAIAINIEIMRTFVKVRAFVATHQDLARQLKDLQDKTEHLAMQQDALASNTRTQLRKVFETLRELMTPAVDPSESAPPKRPIGFVTHEDKKNVPKATQAATKSGRTKKPSYAAASPAHPRVRAVVQRQDGAAVWHPEAAAAPIADSDKAGAASRIGGIHAVLQPCPVAPEPGWLDSGAGLEWVEQNRLATNTTEALGVGAGAGWVAGGVLHAAVAASNAGPIIAEKHCPARAGGDTP